MAVNKVVYGSDTLLDLTADTVEAGDLRSGVTAHRKDGTQVTGTLVVQRYYTGSSAPAASLGSNGDVYLRS